MIMRVNHGARGHWWLIEHGEDSRTDTELDGEYETEELALEAARKRIIKSRGLLSCEAVDVILVDPKGWGSFALYELLKRPVITERR